MSTFGPSLQSQVASLATALSSLNTLYVEMTTKITTRIALDRASAAYDREYAACIPKFNQLIHNIKNADNIDELKRLDFSSML